MVITNIEVLIIIKINNVINSNKPKVEVIPKINNKIDSNYTDIVQNNPNYSLDGTTFYVYTDATYSKRVQDKNNKDIVIRHFGRVCNVMQRFP